MSSRASRAAATPALALLISLSALSAFAQQPPPVDAGSILQQQTREPIRLPAPKEPDLLPRPPEPRPALGAQPKLRVKVSRFIFSGNTLIPSEELEPAVQEFIGKELNFEGLNDAVTEVRARYRSRGYFLAQAYLPEQTIRNGVIEITIIEGRWGYIELDKKPATRISNSLLTGILAAHLQQGGIITETGLERPLLLINDLPDASVTTELRPSDTVGAANLRVNVEPGSGVVTGQVDADNYGNRFTGEYRYGVTMNVNNPLEYGDRFSLRAFTTDEKMSYYRIAYDLPVGYYGTRIGAAYAAFDYALSKDFASLGANGSGTVSSLYLFHSIIRTRNSNLILNLGFDAKRLTDNVTNPTPSTVQQEIDTPHAGFVGDFRDGILGGGLNAWSVIYSWGNLGTTAAAAGTDTHNAQGNYDKYNVDYRRQQRLTEDISFLLSFSGQWAGRNLASAEKMSLGGPNGVRAYPVGEATADQGHVLQNEFRWIVPNFKFLTGDLTFLAFYDYGWAQINRYPIASDTENVRRLTGFGGGAQLGREGNYLLRVQAAWQDTKSKPEADTAQRVPRVWLQGIKWF